MLRVVWPSLAHHVPDDNGEDDNHVDSSTSKNHTVKQGEFFWK